MSLEIINENELYTFEYKDEISDNLEFDITKIVNRETGEVTSGEVPAGSVVVPGTLPSKKPGGPNLYCVVIIKTVDEKTRSKTSVNDLLRD